MPLSRFKIGDRVMLIEKVKTYAKFSYWKILDVGDILEVVELGVWTKEDIAEDAYVMLNMYNSIDLYSYNFPVDESSLILYTPIADLLYGKGNE